METSSEFLDNWEKYMKDFRPEDILNLIIAPMTEEVYLSTFKFRLDSR